MTRNNLAEHLTWLLSNVALTKPATRSYPSASDPVTQQLPQSGKASPQTRTRFQPSSTPAPVSGTRTLHPVSTGADELDVGGDDLVVTREVVVEDCSMGRLTSTTKSKKPLLVSQLPQQLLTPSTTNDGRGKQQAGQAGPNTGPWIGPNAGIPSF